MFRVQQFALVLPLVCSCSDSAAVDRSRGVSHAGGDGGASPLSDGGGAGSSMSPASGGTLPRGSGGGDVSGGTSPGSGGADVGSGGTPAASGNANNSSGGAFSGTGGSGLGACDGEFEHLHEGHCYYYNPNEKRFWEDAELECQVWGGHLVTLNSFDPEQVNVVGPIVKAPFENLKPSVWIGLNDREEEDNFVWASGENSNYTRWGNQSGPNGAEDDQDCVILATTAGYFDDQPCNIERLFVCERW